MSLRGTLREIERVPGVEPATRRALLYFVLPIWLGSGLADWYHHRITRIERTAGAFESLLHLVMLAQAGIPALAGLFLEVNSGTLAASYAALAAHEATALWDVAYADKRREIKPTEQHVHSFLEVGPIMAVTLLTVLNWDQARALFGIGRQRADFALRLKRHALGPRYLTGILTAIVLCGLLPYGEELWRCLRHDSRLAPRPAEIG